MNKMQSLKEILLEPDSLAEASPDIFSVIPEAERGHHYDHTATIYDAIIGNRFYNRLIWGNWPSDYEVFCRQAATSSDRGPMLDAGCGSLVFTAKPYVESEREIVLMDRSLGMLQRAKNRLAGLAGEVPKNITLLQADIFNLPFHPGLFSTIASFGVLHLFDDTKRLLNELIRVKQAGGGLFLSMLAANNNLGRRYLSLLQQRGELSLILTSDEWKLHIEQSGIQSECSTVGNMFYVSTNGKESFS